MTEYIMLNKNYIKPGYLNKTLLLVLFSVLLAGCETLIQEEVPAESVPKSGHLSPLPELPVKNSEHFKLSDDLSEIRVLVFRGGPLAKFGHNHVMLAHDIQGDIYLANDYHKSAFALSFPLVAIEVDPEKARTEEGEEFATRPSREAIVGTRSNMLGNDFLEADKYPDIMIHSISLSGTDNNALATFQITLHGVTREMTSTIHIKHEGEQLKASGSINLKISDFNVKPFSVLGGGLQVQDEIKIKFQLTGIHT